MMRKILFTLVLMLMEGNALADSYLYVDDFTLSPSQMGTEVEIPIKASFDAYVSAWFVKVEYPEGITPVYAEGGEDMTIEYRNARGRIENYSVGLMYNDDYTVFLTSSIVEGYWQDPNGADPTAWVTYGSVKWAAGVYDEMILLYVEVSPDFQGGDLVIETQPSSSYDTRGETVNDIGEHFLTFTRTCHISAPAPFVPMRGDVDMDGTISIADVTELTDYLLTGNAGSISLINADVDDSGSVNIADVTELIDYLLYGVWSNDHEYVDLGLPSGTLWATCNVGASSPEEYGDYFAWGETEPKEVYDWSTYKWCNGSNNTMTKYCTSSSYGYNGFTDGKTELDPEDDAAYVNWGSSWRMPTTDQQKELIDNCTWIWTQQKGVKGRLITGPNGNTLFLPAAGYRNGSSISGTGDFGCCWSRNLYSYSYLAFSMNSNAGAVYRRGDSRYYGNTVRAVRAPQN